MKKKMYILDELLDGSIQGPDQQEIHSVSYDSREIEAGDAFVCIKGEHHDGHLFIRQAIEAGAQTIVGTDQGVLDLFAAKHPQLSFVYVRDSRSALAVLSSHVCGSPSESLHTIGVTGTNGKTTVASFTHSILNSLSFRTGSLGTAGIWDDREKTDFKQTVPTTPEAPDIHKVLEYFCEKNMQAAVIESTSIALEQKRLETIHFNVAIHTNLTPEHLEFHETMDAYKEAKMKLFQQAHQAVINADDLLMADDLIQTFKGPAITYGIRQPADLQASCIHTTRTGTTFEMDAFGTKYTVRAPVFGEYNVSNLLAAIAACHQVGFSIASILSVITDVRKPEGRFQMVDQDVPYQIILDYAHTPDALSHVLESVQHIPHRQLIVMITGIGLRDPKKRPLMAKVVEHVADQIIVSVDQPGHADRKEVVNDVCRGFNHPSSPHIYTRLHREEGIHLALDLAEAGDVVLLTGIGFGGYQIIGDEKVPYSELQVIDSYFENQPLIKNPV
ncbi:UDP-N-acetylmuramoyl-L-alanyl-D-glutamate--2,6-diaminopimelate ligase [Halobacillus litoralis]|uniref:UDP-N-acetylmuramyl-tripeptide synthetase n=1 Tax=Halobacillus litoralis TaxID=45668 RepID=A0A845E2L4_9BACI|nr:UDP-N-acetylmuramoyl-L-alanyl-D-glutamate--2,6-diaminopimelate ligase [Halobacillus litoralis]MYL48923.1 UDP-N-acetylmuramoyl-L-alanyl-D-glutamate--2,6-diaminopimelate ligase [Halobacillus litoralis]